ncbi:MAG: succinylglutamate desuccinylase/aspartoacylase family protein [Halieaceae bacterium]|uniref:succinylglutamate desuccinylase/aspartoacylase family protein n=1 Tax=Haliea alexandrii TaxID=2448162 RepID=UPI001E42BDD5|nr:succinylglutamate desuccinylase/aspartoacylase family protein [Haliea alexandrii]MCR9186109.1 succinylglutamate desuccinylase/aspartoacylase family protein [Halieaceae bacterium]
MPVPLQELVLLGREVPPRTSTRLAWAPTQSFEGIYVDTPVLVVNGVETGPTLCLTAAMHGDELNGIETVRRVLYNLDAGKLKGAVIGVPIVNLQGFHAGSRYLTDRRDLNRYFPGDPKGSSASRLAYSFFHEVIAHCDALVDLHTGSFYRTNLPQLRGDLRDPRVVQLTKGFGSTVVVHSEGTAGTLRRAAVEVGIPAVTLEAGGPSVLSEDAVSHSVKAIRTLLNHLGMTTRFSLWGDPEPVYYNSVWERAQVGGIVFSRVTLGQTVKRGDVLGTVTNPITNVRTRIVSKHNGRIIGMALNQVVQPGFATHHIGITPPKGQISPPEEVVATDAAEARRLLDASVNAGDVKAINGEEAAESEQADIASAGDDETHAAGTESSADEVGDEDLEED